VEKVYYCPLAYQACVKSLTYCMCYVHTRYLQSYVVTNYISITWFHVCDCAGSEAIRVQRQSDVVWSCWTAKWSVYSSHWSQFASGTARLSRHYCSELVCYSVCCLSHFVMLSRML